MPFGYKIFRTRGRQSYRSSITDQFRNYHPQQWYTSGAPYFIFDTYEHAAAYNESSPLTYDGVIERVKHTNPVQKPSHLYEYNSLVMANKLTAFWEHVTQNDGQAPTLYTRLSVFDTGEGGMVELPRITPPLGTLLVYSFCILLPGGIE